MALNREFFLCLNNVDASIYQVCSAIGLNLGRISERLFLLW